MPVEPALVGRTLGGRFHVTRLIGEGAMARVYQAEHTGDPRDVAVKVMHPELAEDPTFLRRFRREAKAAACLRHPNVVQVIDYGVDGELAYIAMELLVGTDLFDVLVAEGRLPPARTVRIMLQICDALQHAHDRGIVHRDLKPENVMILDELGPVDAERIKVLDFGIAKVRERERVDDAPSVSASALTSIGAALGTPEYMSPEQCEGAEVDARSDVYTCGAVMYRVLVGRVPFCGAIALDTMLRHLRDPPTPLSAYVADLHPGLEAVVLKALAKRPADRQQSAQHLATELSALLPELERTDTSPRPNRRVATRQPRVSRGISAPRGAVLVSRTTGSGIEAPATDPDPPTDPDTTTSRQLAHGYRGAHDDAAGEPGEVITDVQTAKFTRRKPPLAAPRVAPRPVPRPAPPPPRAAPPASAPLLVDEPSTPLEPRGASLLMTAVNAPAAPDASLAALDAPHDSAPAAAAQVLGANDTIVMARALAPAGFFDPSGRDDGDAARASVPSFPPGMISDPPLPPATSGAPAQRPVPVLRLFVLTFSIVLVLGIVLLKLAGEH